MAAPHASARPVTHKKAIWGPTQAGGVSLFPTYEELGVGVYQSEMRWNEVAPTRPAAPKDPADPAYRWPADLDFASVEGAKHGIRIAVQVTYAPPWANGGRARQYAPKRPRDYADFVEAAAKRYPGVRIWMIWGEPTREDRFQPMGPEGSFGRLTRAGQKGVRLYARILDAAYGRLKARSRANVVVGGNTFTTGRVRPETFIRHLRLPGGRPPRMDLYGHNPFSMRSPNLAKPPLGSGFADICDLDELTGWLDRWQRRPGRPPLRLFLSEYFAPTDHPNHEFNFYVDQATQARWLRAALRITRRWSRIYSLGVFLYDDAPNPAGDEVNRGLLTWDSRPKPAYAVMRDG
jgi:hypothetical protein